MRKRWKLIAACGAVGIAAITFALTRSTPEPEYEGKPLSSWLETRNLCMEMRPDATVADNAAENELFDQAQNALRHIGTSGIPQMVRWTANEPPNFVLEAGTRWNCKPLKNFFNHDYRRKQLALSYFSWMGPRASGAIPMLSNIVVSARGNVAHFFACDDLQAIGPEGYVAIVGIIENTNLPRDVRLGCVYTVAEQYILIKRERKAQAELLRQSLLQCARDPDVVFRASATKLINTVAPELLTNNAAKN